MWSVADSHIFSPPTISPLILATLRHRVPVFGLSTPHARVAALPCDYADGGRQAGQIALRVLHGEDPATIPVTTPRQIALVLNLRSARNLGIDIPRDLEDEASEVIR